MKIAINGLGRIGRIFLRQVLNLSDFEVVAINDLADKENLLYLLSHDSVYGKFDYDKLVMEKIKFFQEKEPAKLPWKDLKIDVVLEASGVFTSGEKAKSHLDAGAKRVVITAPVPKDDLEVKTFTPNVGEADSFCKITSNASCTTNAITPAAAILAKNPGIEKAVLNTVHAYTATQGLVDGPAKKDFTRGRAANLNMSPSHTGAALAAAKVVPELKDKFDGVAVRVPVVCGSLADFTFLSKRKTTVEEINKILTEASQQKEWQGILKVSKEPLVSTDIIGEPYGAIVDLEFTRVIDGNLVKIFSWYDNEWGYCAMLIKHLEALKKFL